MKIKLIKTSEDYENAIVQLEELGDREDFQNNEDLIADFELLSTLIKAYEDNHYKIEQGDPIEIIKLKMSYMGLTRKDLSHIASSGVLSEIFNKKRGLSKAMIREFSKLLKIDQALLNSVDQPIVELAEKGSIMSSFKFLYLKDVVSAPIEKFKNQVTATGMLFNMSCV